MERLLPEHLDRAVDLLRAGGVLVYPTETSYGIGCDATNSEAVYRVERIKRRAEGKGMTVLLPTLEDAAKYVQFTPFARALAEQYWPGPLNIVAPAVEGSLLSPRCAANGTYAIRLTSHPVAAALVERLGRPLVSTSANLSGKPDLYQVQEIFTTFFSQPEQPDAVLDAGDLPRVPPSTVVRVDRDGVRVLRQGSVVVWE